MMSTHDESAMTPPQLTVDTAAGAAYITLNEGRIRRTVPAGDGILVDFDSEDNVVGVEVLSLTAPLPITDLCARCRLTDEQEQALFLANVMLQESRQVGSRAVHWSAPLNPDSTM